LKNLDWWSVWCTWHVAMHS